MLELNNTTNIEEDSLCKSNFKKLLELYKNDIEWFNILDNNSLFNYKNTYIFITRITNFVLCD